MLEFGHIILEPGTASVDLHHKFVVLCGCDGPCPSARADERCISGKYLTNTIQWSVGVGVGPDFQSEVY